MILPRRDAPHLPPSARAILAFPLPLALTFDLALPIVVAIDFAQPVARRRFANNVQSAPVLEKRGPIGNARTRGWTPSLAMPVAAATRALDN